MSFPNVYMHRKVADTATKSCDICYKLSSSVLITTDNKDFFYICPSHLKDRGFCTPIIDEAAAEAKKKRELAEEVERVKKEYEEKQKKKKEKEKEKEKDKDKSTKDKDDTAKDDSKSEEKKPDEDAPPEEDEPRVFQLKGPFYQQRVFKKRQAEMAKRNRERLADPSFFPSAPSGKP